MILLCQNYISNNKYRQIELDFVKNSNQDCLWFSHIEYVNTSNRATYNDLMYIANTKYKNEICIIANNDIIFNDTIALVKSVLEDNMIIALTRWNDDSCPSMEGTIGLDNSLYSHSQDVWIFRSGTLNEFNNNFCLGIPKCDNRLLFEAVNCGIKVINPAIDIKTMHHHNSGIRTWKQSDAYEGNLFFPKLTTIKTNNTDGIILKQNQRFYISNKHKDHKMSDIEIFLSKNTIDPSFDEIFYQSQYPETKTFYEPYCTMHKIDNKSRLFYHYFTYGIDGGYAPNLNEFLSKNITGININRLGQDIEAFWPPAEDYIKQYQANVFIGQQTLKKSNVAIVSLARNCQKNLKKSIDTMMRLKCNQLKWFIYENDSEDKTKDILNSIKNSNIYISLNNHNIEHLHGLSRERTIALAEYRNICRNWVADNYSDYDYVVVVDLDADLGFSIDGIYNSIYWLQSIDNSGGMGSYSLYLKYASCFVEFSHYDSFAVRLNNWEHTTETEDINNRWFRNLHPLVGSDPICMYSCFGGLGVYKKDAFLSGHYDGSIGSEHVLFHKSLRENGYHMYLNPSSRFFSVYNNDQ